MKLQLPYKNETGQRYTKQLFYEQWINLPIEQRRGEPPFTLSLKRDGLICFREEYVRDGDPTGYTTSVRLLGDYSYWTFLCKVGWFRDALEVWNEELEAKLKSEAMRKIREIAEGDDAKALAAAKFLAQKEYKKTAGTKRGRPSKEEIEGKLQNEVDDLKQLEDDANRIRLIKG